LTVNVAARIVVATTGVAVSSVSITNVKSIVFSSSSMDYWRVSIIVFIVSFSAGNLYLKTLGMVVKMFMGGSPIVIKKDVNKDVSIFAGRLDIVVAILEPVAQRFGRSGVIVFMIVAHAIAVNAGKFAVGVARSGGVIRS